MNQCQEQGIGQGAAAQGEGTVMITETGITVGEVVAEVMIGMNVTGTVGGTEIIVVEAEAAVPALITRVEGGGAMMMMMIVVVEAGADRWIAAPLHIVLVLEGVLHPAGVCLLKGVHPREVLEVKVLIIVAVMDDLPHLAVSHRVVALMLREVHPLGIQMVMSKLSWMKILETP